MIAQVKAARRRMKTDQRYARQRRKAQNSRSTIRKGKAAK